MSDIAQLRSLKATVVGRVQGVSFRYTTQRKAVELGLTGWVQNQPNGDVLTLAEGKEEALREFLGFLHQGPRYARVEQVQAEWGSAEGRFSRFTITG